MNNTLPTSNLQSEFGLRWLIAALLLLCAVGSAQAQNRASATAQLHINVVVVPFVQAQQMALNAHRFADASPVTYHLQPIALRQKREIRDPQSTKKLVGKTSAVLETITTVTE